MVAIISDLLTIVFRNMPFILLFFGINFIQVPIHLLFQPFVFISGISVILQRCEYAYSKIFLSISFYRSPFAEPLKRRIQGKKIDRSNIIKNHQIERQNTFIASANIVCVNPDGPSFRLLFLDREMPADITKVEICRRFG